VPACVCASWDHVARSQLQALQAPAGTACKATLYELLQKKVGGGNVAFASGCTDVPCGEPDMAAVGAAMATADTVVVVRCCDRSNVELLNC
jgi:hypothetical protein